MPVPWSARRSAASSADLSVQQSAVSPVRLIGERVAKGKSLVPTKTLAAAKDLAKKTGAKVAASAAVKQ